MIVYYIRRIQLYMQIRITTYIQNYLNGKNFNTLEAWKDHINQSLDQNDIKFLED